MTSVVHALRQIRLRPGLSAIVILMLAIGIGASTAVFSVFHEILLRPLPVAAPERLVNLAAPGPKWGGVRTSMAGRGGEQVFSYPMFRDLEARQSVFTGIAAHRDFEANLSYEGETLAGTGMLVSGSYFGVLGLAPAAGRLIGPQDEPRVDESAVAVLSHEYWRNYFAGDAGVIGQTLSVNGRPLTIIGVAPAGFSGTTIGVRPDVFVPLTLSRLMQPIMPPDHLENRREYWLYLFARLRPGISAEEAAASLNTLYSGILNEVEAPLNSGMPDDVLERFRQKQITVAPGARGQSSLPDDVSRPLALLLGVTVLVLLVVCVNIANLLLVRGASRTGELAIRASIGADRRQLASQLLVEAGALAVAGGIAGLAVAKITIEVIAALIPAQLAENLTLGLSPTALLFACGVSLATVLLFGSAPAIQAGGADPGDLVKGHASRSSGGRGVVRFRAILAAAQIAFSMILLVLAGLFSQSLVNVTRVDLGMKVESLVTFRVSPRLNGYSPERVMTLYARIEEELAAQPGVLAVSSSSVPVIGDSSSTNSLSAEGFEGGPGVDTNAATNDVSPGFFRTLSIPLLAGRDFTVADRLGAPDVAIVNEAFVRKFELGEDAIGRRFGLGGDNPVHDIEIVGVVADAKYSRVKEEIPPQYFRPRLQNDNFESLSFYVRAGIEPSVLLDSIRTVIASIDPDLPISGLSTMERQIEQDVYVDRLVTMLSVSFAGLATLLAAIGLYGMLAYNVAQRTRELGLRLALGAAPAHLRAMVLKQVGLTALVGVIVGLAGAVGLGRAAEALLFGLSGYDPYVIAAATAVLAAVVLGAGYLPARRASNLAPMDALRHE